MIRQLPLTNSDKTTLVDEDTYAQYCHLNFYLSNGYAITQRLWLHRLIMSPGEMTVDHINGNKLDNRRCNLRVCSNQQNNLSKQVRKTNTSGYKGVMVSGNKWRCRVVLNGNQYYSPTTYTKHAAAVYYNILARVLHGDYFHANTVSDLHALYYYELAH